MIEEPANLPSIFRARWMKHGLVQIVDKNFLKEACNNFSKIFESPLSVFILHPDYKSLYPSIEPLTWEELTDQERMAILEVFAKASYDEKEYPFNYRILLHPRPYKITP